MNKKEIGDELFFRGQRAAAEYKQNFGNTGFRFWAPKSAFGRGFNAKMNEGSRNPNAQLITIRPELLKY